MKKLAIVGTAPSSRDLAPYDNEEYELWGLNGLYSYVKFPSNFTRWFELHETAEGHYYEWLVRCPLPVYVMHEKVIPTAFLYPYQEVLEMFPRKYFTNSISWMIALAIYEGYTDISIYGVDMAQDTEYSHQKPSCEYLLGYCEGKGINLYIPPESDLLKTPYMYGLEQKKLDSLKNKFTARTKELDKRLLELTQREELLIIQHGYLTLVKEKAYLLGCRDDTQYYLKQKV